MNYPPTYEDVHGQGPADPDIQPAEPDPKPSVYNIQPAREPFEWGDNQANDPDQAWDEDW